VVLIAELYYIMTSW